MNKILMLANSSGLSLTDGKSAPLTVAESHPKFEEIFKLVQGGDVTLEEIRKIMDFKEQLKFSDGNIEIEVEGSDLIVKVDGEKRNVVPSGIKTRILETFKQGAGISSFNLKIISKFLARVFQNPSLQVVEQLYRFIEANDLPLTDDGHFLAYKKVDYDYFDLHSHTFNNSVGKTAEMKRNEVRDDPHVTCAEGLHVCSKDYLEHYGSNCPTVNRIVIVDVDPVDVVSVPVDYNNAKMRVCKYEIVDELTDFDVSLAGYFIGKHENGWIADTLEAVKKFYQKFWNMDSKDKFCFDNIGCKCGYITDIVESKFIEEVYRAFNDLEFNEVDLFDLAGKSIMYKPIKLFNLLSRFDSNAVLSEAKE